MNCSHREPLKTPETPFAAKKKRTCLFHLEKKA